MKAHQNLVKALRRLSIPALAALGAGVGILVHVVRSPDEQILGPTERRQQAAEGATVAPAASAARKRPASLRRKPRSAAFEQRFVAAGNAFEQERTLLQELRRLALSDPEQCIALTKDFDERFPEGPRSPERAWYEARSLVDLGRFDEARRIAGQAVARSPHDSWSRDLERHLLSHPFGLPPRHH